MRRLVLPALLVLGLPHAGCIAVAAGACAGYGTAQYVRNEDTRDYAASLASTWAATIATLRTMGYAVPAEAAPEPSDGRLEAGDAKVRVEALSETSTRVHVRVGTFSTEAHRERSASVLDGIGSRLGAR